MRGIISALVALMAASFAFSQTSASGFITYTQNASEFTYNIHLTNTGTTNISTLWYAWIPGQNYMTAQPTNVTGGGGWDILISHTASDGYGVRWNGAANGVSIAPGATLSSFFFTSTMTPEQLAGPTPFHANPPTGTTFVYDSGPFVGGSSQFVINPVPEPATLVALGLGGLALLRRKRRS